MGRLAFVCIKPPILGLELCNTSEALHGFRYLNSYRKMALLLGV